MALVGWCDIWVDSAGAGAFASRWCRCWPGLDSLGVCGFLCLGCRYCPALAPAGAGQGPGVAAACPGPSTSAPGSWLAVGCCVAVRGSVAPLVQFLGCSPRRPAACRAPRARQLTPQRRLPACWPLCGGGSMWHRVSLSLECFRGVYGVEVERQQWGSAPCKGCEGYTGSARQCTPCEVFAGAVRRAEEEKTGRPVPHNPCPPTTQRGTKHQGGNGRAGTAHTPKTGSPTAPRQRCRGYVSIPIEKVAQRCLAGWGWATGV